MMATTQRVTVHQPGPGGIGWLRFLRTQALIALGLAVTAALGMSFMAPGANVPLLWPAAGVALALAYRLGPSSLVGVGLGAFVAHALKAEAFLPAFSLTLGSVAGAGLGALVLRLGQVQIGLHRLRDVLCLFAAVLVAGTVTSAVGSGVVYLSGMTQWSGWAPLWWICWVADTVGALLLAPLLLSRAGRPQRRLAEAFVLTAAVLAVSLLIYADALPTGMALTRPLPYLIFPLLIWAAVRLSLRETALLLLLHGVVGLLFTAMGSGPYAPGRPEESLLALHLHVASLTLSALLLTAAMNERRASEARARQHLRELAHAGRLGAMGEMATGLAHELNQPLCAINSFAQASQRMLAEDADPSLSEALRRIADNAQRAGTIIAQMRAFVRKDEAPRCAMAVNEVVRDVLELGAREACRHGVRVETRLAADLPLVQAVPIQIQQVLLNLLRNAVEAMADSSENQRWLVISSRARGAMAVDVSVRDTGPGLPGDRPEEVLEPFVSHKSGGMGLGLSISRSIIEAHGGRLEARNVPGGGAEFRFTLPVRGGMDT